MQRRKFLKTALAASAAVGLSPVLKGWVPVHNWTDYDFGPGPAVHDRLYQGPFGCYEPENFYGGWCYQSTQPGKQQINCMGMGLITYISGDFGAPVVPGKTLEETIDGLFRFPLGTKVYIRPNWRHIQKQEGKLEFDDYWKITMEKSLQYGKRVGIRVMLNNPDILENALPDFVLKKVPLHKLKGSWTGNPSQVRYQHEHLQPEYNDYLIGYFEEMQNLLAEKYNGGPEIEMVDTHHFGLWGEGHAWPYDGHNFPSRKDAEEALLKMYEIQQKAWTKVPLVTNVQPDYNRVGHSSVIDRSVRDGNWLRRDSILVQNECIDALSNRPAWVANFCEGAMSSGNGTDYPVDANGFSRGDVIISHVKDLKANYYSLWTFHAINPDNLWAYYRKFPDALDDLNRCIGFRVRPSWIWRSSDGEGHENLIFGMVNDGIAGVPGVLRLTVFTDDGSVETGGCLDAGFPHPKGIREAMITLPKGVSADSGRLKLKAEIEVKGVRYPVPIAAAHGVNPDGSLNIIRNVNG